MSKILSVLQQDAQLHFRPVLLANPGKPKLCILYERDTIKVNIVDLAPFSRAGSRRFLRGHLATPLRPCPLERTDNHCPFTTT
jgi:hypothetical protein